jgi:two-component system cell cycle response regulator
MPARILIIEANQANLDLMSYLLRAFGHTLLSAADGQAGLESARREGPDLIICDVQLPGMDGYGVARQLKSDAALRAIPLVAVTALAMVGDREKLLTAGFDGYLAKPIDPENFVQRLDSFLPPGLRSVRVPPASLSTLEPPAPEATGHTILVVDNLAANRELAKSILENSGYQVLLAERAKEAMVLAQVELPDLILCDVCMAEGEGYDFIKVVKADRALIGIPFIFITSAMVNETARGIGLGLGAVRYLFRPIEPEVLLREISACLQERERT